jgi:hypothetical protein
VLYNLLEMATYLKTTMYLQPFPRKKCASLKLLTEEILARLGIVRSVLRKEEQSPGDYQHGS